VGRSVWPKLIPFSSSISLSCILANADYSDENPIKIVGGSFLLQGVTSAAQHSALCKVLRLSIYIYLSVVVEQHLFSDSHVKLNIPKVRSRPAPIPVRHPTDHSQIPRVGEKSPDRNPHTGVWGFLSKKTGGLLNRATSLARHGSLDIRRTARDTPRRSMDAPRPRGRRLSFLADGLPWQTRATKQTEQDAKGRPFRTIVTRIEDFQDLLSTTAGIVFPPPPLLRSIAEKEGSNPTRRLNPDERIRLHYLLGWEGREAQAKGMVGTRGFVRHQEFCALYSEHVLSTPITRTPSTVSTNSEASTMTPSSLTTTSEQPAPVPVPTLCGGRRRWMRFRYYSREDGAGRTLGAMIVRMATTAEDQCGNAGCQSKRGQHELDFIHGGTRVTVNINPLEEAVDEERVDMWQSCVQCSLGTKPVKMSDGTS
jgi:1-phosphatidylinositol-3-phosphate 5-kinase